jgi:hypothetical protein
MGELPGGAGSGRDERASAGITGGYATLIRTALTKRNISNRALHRAGVINERTRRLFDDKLDSGDLTMSEMSEITRFLNINPMRALIAVAYLNDPDAYFDPCCEVLTAYNEQLVTAMTERAAALSGDFTVIHRTLHHCPAHVERISGEIVEQQERTRQWLERNGE